MTEVTEVSVIVPVYNGADTLEGALASILAQGCTDLEVIVVDDGSTDASAAVASRYGPPVRCLRRANGGPSAARNQGLDLARGRFVSFLDADDTWPAGRLRHHLDLFARHPETDIVIGATWTYSAPGADGRALPLLPAPLIQHQLGSATYRRKIFDRVGSLDETLRYGEDLDWFRRALAAGAALRLTGEVALEYRMRPGSLSDGRSDHRHGFLAALHAHLRNRRQDSAGPSAG